MSPEMPKNVESLGPKREGLVNLDALSFDFCADDLVRDFYDKKSDELSDKEKWLEENKEKLEQNKEKIAKAVEDGLIADSQPETIWRFQVDKVKEGQEKVLAIKSELERRVDEIKNEVAKRLGEFLPDWTADPAKIVFTMNERADFCIDGDTIIVDLERLLPEQDPIEKVKKGLTHEIFHLWMFEKQRKPDSKPDEFSARTLRERIIFKTIGEGLAVLIGGQSLETHHAKQGRDFAEYRSAAFESFNQFLVEENRKALERIREKAFQNMGHFYVVGNEIAKAILQHDGIEAFKILISNVRENPAVFLQRYQEICSENTELPRINL